MTVIIPLPVDLQKQKQRFSLWAAVTGPLVEGFDESSMRLHLHSRTRLARTSDELGRPVGRARSFDDGLFVLHEPFGVDERLWREGRW